MAGRPIWYRNLTWNDETAREFEKRLRRCRAEKRPQYLRLQAIQLLMTQRDEVRPAAIQLFHRVLTDFPATVDAPYILEWLAWAHIANGDVSKAEICLRESLRHGSGAMRSGYVDLTLAELLVESREDGHVEEAGDLLARMSPKSNNKMYKFRYWRARTLLAQRKGQIDHARRFANMALEANPNRRNAAAYRPEAETVDPSLVQELEEIAAGPASGYRN